MDSALARISLVLVALALTGCGLGSEKWGGYTEREAKDIFANPAWRREVVQNAPGGPTGEYQDLVPQAGEVRGADLHKVTVDGQEAWEYRDEVNGFCMYVWHVEEVDDFTTQVGPCVAD
jgi:hypothetical protein